MPCCERPLGLDPATIREACGFSDYFGERQGPTSCEHYFGIRDDDQLVPFTVTDYEGLDHVAATNLHMSSLPGAASEVVDGIAWSEKNGVRWAIVDATPPRRVAWRSSTCADAALEPVFREVAVTEVEPHAVPPMSAPAGRPLPALAEGSLLHAFEDRALEPVPDGLALPDKAVFLVVKLLLRAVHDSVDGLPLLLSEDARYGVPDRRELRAKLVFADDDGGRFLDALRTAALRFPRDADRECLFGLPPIEWQEQVRSGAHPFWCHYDAGNGFDALYFKMERRETGARITYVGFFETAPSGPVHTVLEPPPVPHP